jgi:AraC-like DNA-binding protein
MPAGKKIMNLYLRYDTYLACKKILQEQFEKLQLSYTFKSYWEVEIPESLPGPTLDELSSNLNQYGIQIGGSQKSILVQKIKDSIVEMVFMEEKLPTSKTSSYLAEKLNHSYGYIANIFSEVTYTSIENFIILQKIERAKELLITNELTITEIAWRLNYSSVAHLSNQFKNVTGLTPSMFQRIINKRNSA